MKIRNSGTIGCVLEKLFTCLASKLTLVLMDVTRIDKHVKRNSQETLFQV